MNIYEKILVVQHELKAPKGQTNSFGKYKYRSAEDIIEAVKPLLFNNKLIMNISDEIVSLNDGDRYYIKATVTLFDVESGEKISSSALAREDDSKKGMDASQVTGACSSYARKYALNGMFAIDDTKDADTDEFAISSSVDKSKQFNRTDAINMINSMPDNKKNEIFDKYSKESGRKVNDAKFLTSAFLQKIYNEK